MEYDSMNGCVYCNGNSCPHTKQIVALSILSFDLKSAIKLPNLPRAVFWSHIGGE
jgi:hypothetical protein